MKVTFPTLLALLFIGLKLGGVITWSWLAVLSPIWIPFVLAFVILGTIAIVTLLTTKE